MRLYDEGAAWYDLLCEGTPGDLGFYLKEAKKAKGRVLEIACGSGRIYLEILEAGVDAYGLDLSAGMIRILMERAERRGLKPKVRKSDMRTFRYPFKFDLIIIPYRAFLHMETRRDQIRCLKNIRKHLKKGGKLVLNFFDPRMDIISKVDIKWRDCISKDIRTGKMVGYVSYSHYDLLNQGIKSRYVMKTKDPSLPKRELGISLCYIFPREFMNLLELCGFDRWELYGGFNREPYTEHGSELVWIAYK